MYLSPGDILIKEGEKSSELYWLMRGELIVTKKVQNLEVEVNRLKEGDLVGELSFLDQKPRSATVKALTECQLIVLDYTEFQKLLNEQPKWMKKILTTLTSKVRKLSDL